MAKTRGAVFQEDDSPYVSDLKLGDIDPRASKEDFQKAAKMVSEMLTRAVEIGVESGKGWGVEREMAIGISYVLGNLQAQIRERYVNVPPDLPTAYPEDPGINRSTPGMVDPSQVNHLGDPIMATKKVTMTELRDSLPNNYGQSMGDMQQSILGQVAQESLQNNVEFYKQLQGITDTKTGTDALARKMVEDQNQALAARAAQDARDNAKEQNAPKDKRALGRGWGLAGLLQWTP